MNFTLQASPSATTLTDIGKTPVGAQGAIQSLIVCNRGGTGSFRISIALHGATDDPKQYLYYDAVIEANSTFIGDFNIALSETDVPRVYSSNGQMSFMISGTIDSVKEPA